MSQWSHAGDVGLIPGLGKGLGRREWQPTPLFLPGNSHGQRSLAGFSPWGHSIRHDRARTDTRKVINIKTSEDELFQKTLKILEDTFYLFS